MTGATKQNIFTPSGGANQDDSIVTPTHGLEGGVSLFQNGDYRYALNTRIGSSRDDSFGDGENIKDTVLLDSYKRVIKLNINDNFSDGATGWSIKTPGDPGTWGFAGDVALIIINTVGTFTSTILYQTINTTNVDRLRIIYKYTLLNGYQRGYQIMGAYMSGSTVVDTISITDIIFSRDGYQGIDVDLPSNCDGFGLYVILHNQNGSTTDFYFRNLIIAGYTESELPSGTNKVIGKYEDNEFQRIYYFIQNSDGNHAISYFDQLNNNSIELLQWSGLGWSSDMFVKAAKLDNWMAITDRNNPPRLIDTNTISDTFILLGSDFREFHISFHKWAPTVPPIPRVYIDYITNNYDRLKNKVYHFSYRYVYNGNLKSRWSPISKGAMTVSCGIYYTPPGSDFINKLITAIEVDIPGCIFDDPSSGSAYNYFDHSDLKFKSAVKSIELAFRDGELELWKLWKVIPIDEFSRYQYFDGTGNLTPLSDDDFNQPFDTVPFKAGTVEAVDNRFVFADCLDEETPMSNLLITDVSVVSNPITSDWTESLPTALSTFTSVPPTERSLLLRTNALSQFNFKDRGVYKIGIQWIHRNGWRSAIYTDESWSYIIQDTTSIYANKLIGFNFTIQSTPPEWAVGYQIFRTNALTISYFMYGIVNKFTPLIDDVSTILDQVTLPEDIRNRVRQHFENELIVDSDAVVADINTEVLAAISADKKKNKRRNNFARDQRRIGDTVTVATGIGIESTISRQREKDLRRNSIAPKLLPELRKTKEINLVADCSRIYIDVNNWYYGAKKSGTVDVPTGEYPLNKLFYNYKIGDRVRFVGSDVAVPSDSDLKEYDVPIIEFTGKGIIIEKPVGLLWMPGRAESATVDSFYTIEVYTPKTPTQADHLFYEMGEWYPVLYPGKSNRSLSKTDFVYTNNAAVTVNTYGPFNFFNKIPLFYADCYDVDKVVYRDTIVTPSPSLSGINVSMNPDPDKTFGYWDKNNGRVSIAYQDLPVSRFKPTQARFGGKIVEESFVNNLNNFFDEDQLIYPSEYGRIRNLINTSNAQVESVGSILLAIGEREAWSIYVNRTTLEDLSGNTQVGESDQVLGSYNTLLGSYGTMNPESVSLYRGNVYWWSVIKGTWVRYGRDGLTPLSDNKKRNWFKELSDLLIGQYMTSSKPVAISEFDPFNDELVTFLNHNSLPSTFRGYADYKGDTFSETDKRWKMNHSYAPEMFGKLNNRLYGFKDGKIYQFEAGTGYSRFFGVKHDVKIEPVFNQEMMDAKSWQTIRTIGTHAWSAERILSEFRGDKTIQLSNIPLDNFQDLEDMYDAAVLNDENTPNTNLPLIEGNKMRSKAIRVLLKLDPSVITRSLLHYVSAGYIDSPKKTLNS